MTKIPADGDCTLKLTYEQWQFVMEVLDYYIGMATELKGTIEKGLEDSK